MTYLQFLAETSSSSDGGFAAALGIDWRLLIAQIAAFLLLVWLLGKFVYPWLMKSVDDRQKNVEEAAHSARIAKDAADSAKANTEALIKQARLEANEIVDAARQEAANTVANSEKRARGVAEQITNDAQQQIQKDITKAREDLYNETLNLIELATEKVVQQTHTEKADANLVKKALEDVSR